MYGLADVLTDESHYAEAEKLCRETLESSPRRAGLRASRHLEFHDLVGLDLVSSKGATPKQRSCIAR